MKEKILLWLVPRAIVIIQKFVGLTSRRIDLGTEHIEKLRKENKPWIYAIWHASVLYSPYLLRGQQVAVMISASRDGELITRVVEKLGNFGIRGSTSRGGVGALKSMIRHQRKGNPAAFTPDGPRGPAFRLQPGIITSAQISGAPIVPFHYECTRQWIAHKSWDQHRIPKPFTTFVVSYGEPIFVPSELEGTEFGVTMERVEKALIANMELCREKTAGFRADR